MGELERQEPREERRRRRLEEQAAREQMEARRATASFDDPAMQAALAIAPREQLIALMQQLRFAAFYNLEASRDERDRAEEWRRQAEVFKGLYDRAMTFAERFGGNELPELLELRREGERHERAARGRAAGAARGRARAAPRNEAASERNRVAVTRAARLGQTKREAARNLGLDVKTVRKHWPS